MNASLLVEMMANGSVIDAVTTLYTDLIGSWFYVILLFTSIMVIYLKTENVAYTVIFGLLGGSVFITEGVLPIQYHNIFSIIMYFSMAILLWITFRKSDD